MAILITGGAGYIGSHVTVELISAGYEVVSVSQETTERYRRDVRILRVSFVRAEPEAIPF